MTPFEAAPPRKPSLRDIGMLILCVVFGIWLLTYGQKEWGNDSLYRVKTKLLGPDGMVLSDEIKTGWEMNRNRMILGVVSLAYGGYIGWKIMKNRSRPPENNARDVTEIVCAFSAQDFPFFQRVHSTLARVCLIRSVRRK